jgi:hypothetical protein
MVHVSAAAGVSHRTCKARHKYMAKAFIMFSFILP